MRPLDVVIWPDEVPSPVATRLTWSPRFGKPLGEAEELNLRLLAAGYTAEQIGRRRSVSAKTVKAQLQLSREKLGARNGPHLVALWLEKVNE